jgi:hypothetical protein
MGKRAIALRAAIATAAAVLVGVVVVQVLPSGASIAQGRIVSTNPVDYTPNINDGQVYKMAEVNGVLYAGGVFTSVTPSTGGAAIARSNILAFNAATGAISTTFAPSINGEVWAITYAGNALYVGGTFTSVDGVARRGLAKLDPTTGALDPNFNANLNGDVKESALVNGRLMISGTFSKRLTAVHLDKGTDPGYIKAAITGTVASNAGPTQVYRFAVDPAGTRLVGIGNFTAVGGASHIRAFMMNLSASGSAVSTWNYAPLNNPCSSTAAVAYLRDVDFSTDGGFFVLVATGYVAPAGTIGTALCDSAARFETWNLAPSRPTWINYTGGDTLHSVAVTDKAVYVQGHQRWLDNPNGRDAAGPGAVSRPGIGAIDPRSGKALSWNPTKDRGEGGRDFLVTARGLWVASDTNVIAGETHKKIALLP